MKFEFSEDDVKWFEANGFENVWCDAYGRTVETPFGKVRIIAFVSTVLEKDDGIEVLIEPDAILDGRQRSYCFRNTTAKDAVRSSIIRFKAEAERSLAMSMAVIAELGIVEKE